MKFQFKDTSNTWKLYEIFTKELELVPEIWALKLILYEFMQRQANLLERVVMLQTTEPQV
jgi:hypothetical protein